MRRKEQLRQDYDQFNQKNVVSREVVQIRRGDRETTFSKKRNNFRTDYQPSNDAKSQQNNDKNQNQNTQENSENTQSPQHEDSNPFIILDQRYAAQIKQFNEVEVGMDLFHIFVDLLKSDDHLKIVCGAICLRRLLSSPQPPIQEVFDANIVDLLLQLAQLDSQPQIQMQATWCIANIASGTTDHCSVLIRKGVIGLLVNLMRKNATGIIEQAIWGLGNIATDCSQYRNMVIEAGAIQVISDIVLNGKIGPQFAKECCWTLANICRGHPPPQYGKVKAAIMIICSMLASGCVQSVELFVDCCWALSYHCVGAKKTVKPLLDFNVLGRLIPIGNATSNVNLILPCLRIVGQVSTGGYECAQAIIINGGLQLLEKCLFNQKKLLRRETVWILSNLTASRINHIQQILLRTKLMTKVVQMFFTDSQEVRKEIGFMFSNMCLGGRSLILDQMFIECDIMQGYLLLLESDDSRVVHQALQNLELVLSLGKIKKEAKKLSKNVLIQALLSGRGSTIVQNLQLHSDESIYLYAHSILKNYAEDLQDPLERKPKPELENQRQTDLRVSQCQQFTRSQ